MEKDYILKDFATNWKKTPAETRAINKAFDYIANNGCYEDVRLISNDGQMLARYRAQWTRGGAYGPQMYGHLMVWYNGICYQTSAHSSGCGYSKPCWTASQCFKAFLGNICQESAVNLMHVLGEKLYNDKKWSVSA